jgi:hypothetical protein
MSDRSMVVLSGDQVSSDLGGDAVILHLRSGVYYSLDAVGGRIWNLLREPTSVGDLRDTLLDEYEVDADRCERELLALLQELASEGLIEVSNENAL